MKCPECGKATAPDDFDLRVSALTMWAKTYARGLDRPITQQEVDKIRVWIERGGPDRLNSPAESDHPPGCGCNDCYSRQYVMEQRATKLNNKT